MFRFTKLGSLFLFVVTVSFAVVFTQSVYSQESCQVEQITNVMPGNTDIDDMVMSADDNIVVFESAADVTGTGATTGVDQIFIYDIAADSITQATNGSASSSDPFPSADGNIVAFDSRSDLIPGQNVDGSREIFLYNRTSGAFTQITDSVLPVFNNDASIDATGNLVVFRSSDDFTGQNADGNQEIFLYNVVTDTFTQVSDTTNSSNFYQQISSQGNKVSYTTTDLNTFTTTLSSYDVATTATTHLATSPISLSEPRTNADGSTLVFRSSDDLVPPGNIDMSIEIFTVNTNTAVITQITDTPSFTCDNFDPWINGDGTRLVFISGCDFTGVKGDGDSELVLYDSIADQFSQITDNNAGPFPTVGDPGIGGIGNVLSVASVSNYTNENPQGATQLFLAFCPTTVVIDGCDSGVDNVQNGDGDFLSELIEEAADGAKNHGKFVSAVAKILNDFKAEGLISGEDKDAIQSCAAESNIP